MLTVAGDGSAARKWQRTSPGWSTSMGAQSPDSLCTSITTAVDRIGRVSTRPGKAR